MNVSEFLWFDSTLHNCLVIISSPNMDKTLVNVFNYYLSTEFNQAKLLQLNFSFCSLSFIKKKNMDKFEQQSSMYLIILSLILTKIFKVKLPK